MGGAGPRLDFHVRLALHAVDAGDAAHRGAGAVAGLRPGRETNDETILFWHRGLSLSDIALAHAMIEKGERLGIGQKLRFA